MTVLPRARSSKRFSTSSPTWSVRSCAPPYSRAFPEDSHRTGSPCPCRITEGSPNEPRSAGCRHAGTRVGAASGRDARELAWKAGGSSLSCADGRRHRRRRLFAGLVLTAHLRGRFREQAPQKFFCCCFKVAKDLLHSLCRPSRAQLSPALFGLRSSAPRSLTASHSPVSRCICTAMLHVIIRHQRSGPLQERSVSFGDSFAVRRSGALRFTLRRMTFAAATCTASSSRTLTPAVLSRCAA